MVRVLNLSVQSAKARTIPVAVTAEEEIIFRSQLNLWMGVERVTDTSAGSVAVIGACLFVEFAGRQFKRRRELVRVFLEVKLAVGRHHQWYRIDRVADGHRHHAWGKVAEFTCALPAAQKFFELVHRVP